MATTQAALIYPFMRESAVVRGSAMNDEFRARTQRRRVALVVRGVVQGVGFRPFVYRLALAEELAGFVGNDTDGVTIEVEGDHARVASFLVRLRAELPPLARIDSVVVSELPLTGLTEFHIVPSQVLGRVNTGIPADAATCADCLRELLDPTDRRYRYPFLNCTNCGPRFTITRSPMPAGIAGRVFGSRLPRAVRTSLARLRSSRRSTFFLQATSWPSKASAAFT